MITATVVVCKAYTNGKSQTSNCGTLACIRSAYYRYLTNTLNTKQSLYRYLLPIHRLLG